VWSHGVGIDSANVRQRRPPSWLKMLPLALSHPGPGRQSLVVTILPPVAAM
jgi:hypothetical protein